MKNIPAILFLFVSQLTFAQPVHLDWAVGLVGANSSHGHDIAVDQEGNVLITGAFFGTCDFDPGPDSLMLTAFRTDDLFIQKLDPNGNLIWAKAIGGYDYDRGYSITTDHRNNVFVTGQFDDSVDFDPGPGVHMLYAKGHLGADTYILKLNADGEFQWAYEVGEGGSRFGQSVSADTFGNVYLAADFWHITDIDPGPDSFMTPPANGIFISKFDSNGNFLWANLFDGQSDDNAMIQVDLAGNVYVAGSFYNFADFDPSPNTMTINAAGAYDIYLYKLDTAGSLQWVRTMGGKRYESCWMISLNEHGELYIGGYFEDTVDLDPGSGVQKFVAKGTMEAFVSRFDTDGNFYWSRAFGHTNRESPYGVAATPDGGVIMTGFFNVRTDLDPGPAQLLFNCRGEDDMFVSKLDSNGELVYAYTFGSTDTDAGWNIATDRKGSAYVTGWYTLGVDFDPGPDTFMLPYQNYRHALVLKLSGCDPVHSTDSITVCDSMTWINGITYSQSTNSPTYKLVSAGGCDSIVHLALTILRGAPFIDSHFACDSFQWIDGMTYYASNDSAVYVLTSANGCDSVIELHLTVVTLDSSVLNAADSLYALGEADEYQWLDCSNGYSPVQGAKARVFKPAADGVYAVRVEKMGCVDTSVCIPFIVHGIEQAQESRPIVFPNPGRNAFTLRSDPGLGDYTITVYNSLGQVVKKQKSRGDTVFHLNTPPGMYTVHVGYAGGTSYVTLVSKIE